MSFLSNNLYLTHYKAIAKLELGGHMKHVTIHGKKFILLYTTKRRA